MLQKEIPSEEVERGSGADPQTDRHGGSGEFRKNGIVATGLNDLMKAAGLTHGGFYKHFESKDQLVAEACAEAVETILEMLAAAAFEEARAARTSRPVTETIRPPDARCPRSAANLAEATKKPGPRRRLAS